MENKRYNLTVGYLYPTLLNTYGDRGNVMAFQKRAEWLGIHVTTCLLSLGSTLKPNQIDIYFIGGGQDKSQHYAADDLMKTNKGTILCQEINRGIPLLAICAGFQLLGRSYQPLNGSSIPGLGIFPISTLGNSQRMIGNIMIRTEFGEVIGFENHSGETHLESGATPFGEVMIGFGNNHERKTEGCRYKNAIGSYLHGPLLPKNTRMTDWLLWQALSLKYDHPILLEPLDDSLEEHAFLNTKRMCYRQEIKPNERKRFKKFRLS